MADSVGSYPVSTFTTPAQGAAGTSSVLRGNFNTVGVAHTNHDADAALHWQTTVFASLPGTGTGGKAKYVTTDGRRVYLDLTNGAALSELAYLPLVGGTVSGATGFTTGLTAGASPPAGSEPVRINGDIRMTGGVVSTNTMSASGGTEFVHDSSGGGVMSVSDTANITLSNAAPIGYRFGIFTNQNFTADVMGGLTSVTLRTADTAAFSTTKDNAGTTNIYADPADSYKVKLQNMTGGGRQYRVSVFKF